MKADVVYGIIVDGLRQPIIYSFSLYKEPGFKVLCEPETIPYKEKNKSVFNTNTFYLKNDKNKEVNFNRQTLTFTLQMIKV